MLKDDPRVKDERDREKRPVWQLRMTKRRSGKCYRLLIADEAGGSNQERMDRQEWSCTRLVGSDVGLCSRWRHILVAKVRADAYPVFYC